MLWGSATIASAVMMYGPVGMMVIIMIINLDEDDFDDENDSKDNDCYNLWVYHDIDWFAFELRFYVPLHTK